MCSAVSGMHSQMSLKQGACLVTLVFFPETYPIMVECVGIVGLATLHLSWVLQQAIFHTVCLFLPCRGLITYV